MMTEKNRSSSVERSFKHLESCKDPITEKEKKDAYELFRRKRPEQKAFVSKLETSILRDVREALHLSASQAADLIGVSKNSYQSFEAGEVSGAISLKNLRKCAEGLGCEFVYELRTRDGEPIDLKIWNEVFEVTKTHGYLYNCVASRRAYALHDLITKKLNDPKYRRKKRWSLQTPRYRPLYE